MSLQFYNRPVLVPVFANPEKWEEDFPFDEKKEKSENSIQAFNTWFVVSFYTGSVHPKQ